MKLAPLQAARSIATRLSAHRSFLPMMRSGATSRRVQGWMAPAATVNEASIFVNSRFESGNVEVVDISDPQDMQLEIRPDPYCATDNKAHFQWFSYRVTGVRGLDLKMRLTNAGGASYPPAWNGYQAVASYDQDHWFRVPTSYDAAAGTLTIEHRSEHDAVHFAYFAPYTLERHSQLIHQMQVKPNVTLHTLGQTLDGRDLDLLQLGTPAPGKPNLWVIARQHPGEAMAEWFAEGLLQRMADPHDPVARQLLGSACLWVVPNMNPDGTSRGHLRTNAAGFNLNRGWANPTLEECPEVTYVRSKLMDIGCDLLLDVHGDEELPYNFFIMPHSVPSWNERVAALSDAFAAAFERASPDFQTTHGYPPNDPGATNLAVCNNWVAEHVKCVAVTLEMPFKDTIETPDVLQGWSPERCVRLGAAMCSALNQMVPLLVEHPGAQE